MARITKNSFTQEVRQSVCCALVATSAESTLWPNSALPVFGPPGVLDLLHQLSRQRQISERTRQVLAMFERPVEESRAYRGCGLDPVDICGS